MPVGPSTRLLLQLRELPTCRSQPTQGPLQTHPALGSAASRTLSDRGPSSCAAFLCCHGARESLAACEGRLKVLPGWRDWGPCVREADGQRQWERTACAAVKGRLEKVFLYQGNKCQVASSRRGQAQLLCCCAAAAPVASWSEVCWRKRSQ